MDANIMVMLPKQPYHCRGWYISFYTYEPQKNTGLFWYYRHKYVGEVNFEMYNKIKMIKHTTLLKGYAYWEVCFFHGARGAKMKGVVN